MPRGQESSLHESVSGPLIRNVQLIVGLISLFFPGAFPRANLSGCQNIKTHETSKLSNTDQPALPIYITYSLPYPGNTRHMPVKVLDLTQHQGSKTIVDKMKDVMPGFKLSAGE